MESSLNAAHREPWNKGKIVGQKAPFKVKGVWALRAYLKVDSRVRELALFNLGIDSKLRGCDLVGLKVRDSLGLSDTCPSRRTGDRSTPVGGQVLDKPLGRKPRRTR